MFKLLVLIFSFPSLTFSSEIKEYSFDNNKDGKMDSFYKYDGPKTLKISLDRNYDGKLDYIKEYQVKKLYFKEVIDNDFNGTFEKVVKAQIVKDRIFINEFKDEGKKLIRVNNFSKEILASSDNACYEHRNDLLNEIDKLVGSFSNVVNLADDKFYYVNGFKFDESCSANFGKKKTSKLLAEIQNEGLLCLKNIASSVRDQKKQPEIFQLLNKMNIQLNNPDWLVTLSCSQSENFKKDKKSNDKISSDSAVALGSIAEYELNESIKHPMILLNPELEFGFFDGNISSAEFKSTVFHEMIHNYGYSHGEGVDLAYGCEVCCFNEEFDKKSKQHACNICSGRYDEFSEEYLKDISLLNFYTDLVVGKKLYMENYSHFGNTKTVKQSFVALFSNLHPGLLRTLNTKYNIFSKEENKDIYWKLSQTKHPSEVLENNLKLTAKLVDAIFFEKDKLKIISVLNEIDLKAVYDVDDHRMNLNGLNIFRSGGKRLVSDIKSILIIAVSGENDPELKEFYNSKLNYLKGISPSIL